MDEKLNEKESWLDLLQIWWKIESEIKVSNLHLLPSFFPLLPFLLTAVSSPLLKQQWIIFFFYRWLFLTAWLEEMDCDGFWLAANSTVLSLVWERFLAFQILTDKYGHSRGSCNPNQETLFLLMCCSFFPSLSEALGNHPHLLAVHFENTV